MIQGLLGTKVGMTRIFYENGQCIPVTVIEVQPNVVVQRKTMEKDGYQSAQVGYHPVKKAHLTSKPMRGHFKDITPTRWLREFAIENDNDLNIKDELEVAGLFTEGEIVDVAGTSKGKGFQGVIKRHGFSGGPASHGSHFHRTPGSIGAHTFPGRVFRGQKMPGRMGGVRVMQRNLKIEKIFPEKHLLLVRGAVPGHQGALLEIRKK